MNETTRTGLDQEVVELGDAKEVTQGIPYTTNLEENTALSFRNE